VLAFQEEGISTAYKAMTKLRLAMTPPLVVAASGGGQQLVDHPRLAADLGDPGFPSNRTLWPRSRLGR
jgi:hypothetical protein